eukprot:gnl/TRDRNA2_/TRDRNA2_154749_c0_seq1.p1 gnl/TRDRNA2_/TRDRNA2_154749_c0~~gnl/TRDRNA2_/TRDRNA2_154749_c0_seq1.p1  ORF type:complete len:1034 (-),score=214.84 gnl/TRDRNA2_/TRDRNA2_154749_c0_seq1:274-3291(-)
MAAEAIKVAVRVRPLNARENTIGSPCVVNMSGTSTVINVNPQPKTFTYDYSYDSMDPSSPSFASQDMVYNDIGSLVLKNALDGYNGCIFAYGQTGSGKSYSVMGGPKDPGVIPRVVDSLFQSKARLEAASEGEARIWVSYLEIYNEHIRDLLHPGNEQPDLKVVDHADLGVCVPGLVSTPCPQQSDVQRLMDFGTKKRVTSSTNMNATSSRSHAVFTIKVQRLFGPMPGAGQKDERRGTTAKINLVDLAGSERVAKSQSEGKALKEGCAINQSLSALGLIIKELSEHQIKQAKKGGAATKQALPFRSSKLTFLLKDSLAGNSRTFMLAAISPAMDNVEETLSTLRFASSVKKIKTVAVQNMHKKDELIMNLQAEIKKLKTRLMKKGSVGESDSDVQEEIAARERMLEEQQKSYDHQLAEAAHFETARSEALKDMGLTAAEIDEVFGLDQGTPYLLNMNSDPALSGCLMYFLQVGMVTTIGANPENGVVLAGLGISDYLCQIHNADNKTLVLSIVPGPPEVQYQRGRVRVNGASLDETPVQMKHNDKLIFGRAYAMRIIIPAGAHEAQDPVNMKEQLQLDSMLNMLMPEESEAWGELRLYFDDLWQRLGQERGTEFFQQLSEASHLVDEANDITAEVRPAERLKFEVELVWDIHREAHDIIIIRVMQFPQDGSEAIVLAYWTLARFMERLDMMRDAYEHFHRKGEWEHHGNCLEDPWLEPSFVELNLKMHTHAEDELQKREDRHNIMSDDRNDETAQASRQRPSAGATDKRSNLPTTAAPKSRGTAANTDPGKKITSKVVSQRTRSPPAPKYKETAVDSVEHSDPVISYGAPPQDANGQDVVRGPGFEPADTFAAQGSKDTLIAVLREQLKDKDDKERRYKDKIAALQRRLVALEQQHGPLLTLAAGDEKPPAAVTYAAPVSTVEAAPTTVTVLPAQVSTLPPTAWVSGSMSPPQTTTYMRAASPPRTISTTVHPPRPLYPGEHIPQVVEHTTATMPATVMGQPIH